MEAPASLLDLIAHGGSMRAAADNDLVNAQTAHTQASARSADAGAQLAQAQIPVQQQLAEQERLKTQLGQRQLRDEEIQRQIWADWSKANSQQATQPPPAEQAPAPPPAGAPVPASPAPQPAAQPQPALPNYLDNPVAYGMELARRGGSAPAVQAAISSGVALKKSIAGLSKEQLDLEKENHGIVADSLQGYLNTPEAQRSQAYPQFYADAIQREPNLARELPAPGSGVAPTQDDLAHVIGKVHLFGTLLSNAEVKQKTATSAAEQAKAEADTKKTNAELPGVQADAKKKQLVQKAMEDALANPQQGAALIDSALPASLDKQANAAFKASWQASMQAGDTEGAARAVATAASHAATISMANNPTMIAGAANKARAEAYATIGPKVQEQVQAQKELAKNAPGAFSEITEPSARHDAEREFDKATDEYHDKAIAARSLKSLIDAATSGNKAASAVIPLAEVRAFVNRVNSTELKSVAGAGSLADKVEGWVKGKTEGQPIPPDILKATRELADLQEKQASDRYDLSLSKLKAKGAKPARVELPGPVTVQTPHGAMQFPDQERADAFKKAAGLP